MISYEVYKFLHISAVVVFVSAVVLALFAPSVEKINKVTIGITSLIILIAGMGLLARIGVGHGGPWPLWAILKVIIWTILAIGAPIAIKRWRERKRLLYGITLLLVISAAFLAIFK